MSTPSSSTQSFPLDYYMRPGEITNCIYASNDTSCPYICACENVPDKIACEDGYVHAASFTTRKDDPNPLINKCMTDVPSTFSSTGKSKDSWIAGCFSGVKGRHKLFDPTKINENSCESIRQRMGWQ